MSLSRLITFAAGMALGVILWQKLPPISVTVKINTHEHHTRQTIIAPPNTPDIAQPPEIDLAENPNST